MTRIPFAKSILDPRRTNNFLDSCAFDPKYAPEHEAAQKIRILSNEEKIQLLLAHSNQKEIDHPNTPVDVKQEAAGMIYTIETSLTSDEIARKAQIHLVLTGNGSPEKYASDALHVFEAGKYHGYFITTDHRILNKRGELQSVSAATIVTPSEWLRVFNETIPV